MNTNSGPLFLLLCVCKKLF